MDQPGILDICDVRYPQPPYRECAPRDREALQALWRARNIVPDACLAHLDAAIMVILRRDEQQTRRAPARAAE